MLEATEDVTKLFLKQHNKSEKRSMANFEYLNKHFFMISTTLIHQAPHIYIATNKPPPESVQPQP